jgi:hypothetical protein
MSSVTFSTTVGGDGSTVTDDDDATTGLRNGGWRTRFVPALTQEVAVAANAVASATAALSSKNAASTSATNAATSASNASTSATNAASSATAAAASYDSFDDRYLGAKTSDPTVDNDGNALLTGALYWNSATGVFKVWSGSAWITNITSNQFGTNVATFLQTPTSANLAAALTDETGSGANVFATSPTLVTPVLGVATGTSFQGIIGNVTPAAGTFTTLTSTGNATLGDAEATDTHAIKGATTLLANSASAALTVTQTGAGNAFVVEDSASADATPFVINGSGNVIVGYTTQFAISGTTAKHLQSSSTSGAAGLTSTLWSSGAAASAPAINVMKSRGTAQGSYLIVANADTLGTLNFVGDDGAAFLSAASITGFVDGTPGTNDMPGRLVFSTTADGAASPTERMRIDSAGSLGVGTASPDASAILDVQSTTKGVRMPNMTTTQKNAIASPAAGLMVFDTTLSKLCVYSGAAWQTITSV